MTAAILHQCILPANITLGLNEPDSAAALAPLCMTCMTESGFLSLRTTYAFFTQFGIILLKFNRYELLARWSRRSKAEHQSVRQHT